MGHSACVTECCSEVSQHRTPGEAKESLSMVDPPETTDSPGTEGSPRIRENAGQLVLAASQEMRYQSNGAFSVRYRVMQEGEPASHAWVRLRVSETVGFAELGRFTKRGWSAKDEGVTASIAFAASRERRTGRMEHSAFVTE